LVEIDNNSCYSWYEPLENYSINTCIEDKIEKKVHGQNIY